MDKKVYYGVFYNGVLITYHGALAIFPDRSTAATLIQANNEKVKHNKELDLYIDLVRVVPFTKKE